jgi:hypothetical protein
MSQPLPDDLKVFRALPWRHIRKSAKGRTVKSEAFLLRLPSPDRPEGEAGLSVSGDPIAAIKAITGAGGVAELQAGPVRFLVDQIGDGYALDIVAVDNPLDTKYAQIVGIPRYWLTSGEQQLSEQRRAIDIADSLASIARCLPLPE